jgi:antibiotic biosynthesis monooxygenase (ABM) superfamily enzyme
LQGQSAGPAVTLGARFSQQGLKLVGSGAVDPADQGYWVSLSADGNTALVGADNDNSTTGAAWVWTRRGGVWTQQGSKLVGSGPLGAAGQGKSVSLSADGNTALIGGPYDNDESGATWVWVRNGDVWTQQGPKLVGAGAARAGGNQGWGVSLSADGNTALVGAPGDNDNVGAAWVWTRSGGVWTQQGPKLVGSDAAGSSAQGYAVSLSADGNTALVGGYWDNGYTGAVWVWTRSGGVWTQQGPKLVGSGALRNAFQGLSVALSANGDTALVGGPVDGGSIGAAWVWTRNGGVWTQQGPKLVGSGATGAAGQGRSVSLSADGDIALVGGAFDNGDTGATWVWTRTGEVWIQRGPKLVGSGVAFGRTYQGWSTSLAADGRTALVGGYADGAGAGAAWVFTHP